MIQGMKEFADFHWFIQDISPGIFFLERFRANATQERKDRIRKGAMDNMNWQLKQWGY